MNKAIRITVSALLLSFIAWRTNWSEFGGKFAQLSPEGWCIALVLYLLAMVATARRWQLFARELHFEQSLTQYSAYCLIGMYFNLLLPTSFGGDVMRVWYLDGQSGRRWAALASVFLERVHGLLVLIALACVGILSAPVDLPGWISASVWGSAGCAVVCMASIPVLQRWRRLSLERRQQLQIFLMLLRCPRMVLEAALMSIVVQGAGVLILWRLGLGLGLDVPLAYYCVVCPMVSLLMLLPLSVNGMGVREGGMVLFLTPLGVDEPTALALAFLWFSVGIAVSLIGGLVYLSGMAVRREPAPEASGPLSC